MKNKKKRKTKKLYHNYRKAVIVTQINKLTSLFWLFTGNSQTYIYRKKNGTNMGTDY